MIGEEGYSQFVGFLKFTLPLAALALMSTVFLFARAPTQENEIPYAELEEIAQESRVSGAQLSGVAGDGSVVEISARRAVPFIGGARVEAVTAVIESVDGTIINLSAGGGEINNANRTTELTGLTRIQTSNGYEMETTGVTAEMDTGRIITDGALEIQTPFGELTAGKLTIETPNDSSGQVMLFQNGVRLIYTPQQ